MGLVIVSYVHFLRLAAAICFSFQSSKDHAIRLVNGNLVSDLAPDDVGEGMFALF
jgi:hypothetical protein